MSVLQGDKIKLTQIKEKDAEIISSWYEDVEFLRLFEATATFPKSPTHFKKWVEQESHNSFRFAIRQKSTDSLVGFVEIDSILWNHRNAWIAMALGRNYWNKGLGTDSLKTALRYAFQELNLNRLQLSVFSYNERAIALYEKLGFQKEGAHREFLERDGEKYDMLMYGMLKREWKG